VSTTDVSTIRLRHAAVNAGLADGPDAKPTKMRHLCKSMQKAVQDTAGCLLAIISISGPSPFSSTPIPEGFSHIQITHHELGHRVRGSPCVAIVSPLNFRMVTTDVSAFRLGHAAANAGLADGPDAKPTKMCHLHKSMQKAVQDTACCLLTVISISGPSPFGSTPVSQGLLPHPNYSS